MSDEIVIIIDHANGNGNVGEMWQETKIFNEDDTLSDVLAWAQTDSDYKERAPTRKRITITRPA